jgi:hypothetical protein
VRPFPIVLALLGTIPLPFLVGCGSNDNGIATKPPAEILAAARTSASGASSVHVTLKASVGKAKATLDGSLAREQSYVQMSEFGRSFEMIRDGTVLYVRGNRVFDAGLEEALGVKIPRYTWLKGTTTGALGQLSSITNPAQELAVILTGSGQLAKAHAAKIDGQPAIAVRQARKLSTATLYVATTGKPYPLQLRKIGTESGQTTFTDWSKPVHIDPPAKAVEISQLPKTGG